MTVWERQPSQRREWPLAAGLFLISLVVIGLLAWISITQGSRHQRLLLISQGTALTEAIAEAAGAAIDAELTYEQLWYKRLSELLGPVFDVATERDRLAMAESILQSSDLIGGAIFASSGEGTPALFGNRLRISPGETVDSIARDLLTNRDAPYRLFLADAEETGGSYVYYFEPAPDYTFVVLLVCDGTAYRSALERTQIGYFAQKISREPGVSYVLYQTPTGIIFSSKRISEIPAIAADPFLIGALESDTITSREYMFSDELRAYEFVRPFSSRRYPFGLLRVGVTLDRFEAIQQGYRSQVLIVAGSLVSLLVVGVLFFRSGRRRREDAARFGDYQSAADTAFQQLKVGVAAFDATERIRFANGAFESLIEVRNLAGRSWREAIAMEPLRSLPDSWRNIRTSEVEFSFSVAGQERTLLAGFSGIAGRADQPFGGGVCILTDVTRVKEIEREAAMRERLSEMGNLAAGVAHEIRNPLNAIAIAAQRLEMELSAESDTATLSRSIQTEARRLNEIVTRFLSLARGQRMDSEFGRFDLLLSELLVLAIHEGEMAGVTTTIQCRPEYHVRTDRNLLSSVLINLHRNACEALAPRNGSITVAVNDAPTGAILSVTDTGPGIPPENRQKIFSPYFTTRSQGTGLGLAAVHAAIQSMGWEIRIADLPTGRGTRFEILIPAGDIKRSGPT